MLSLRVPLVDRFETVSAINRTVNGAKTCRWSQDTARVYECAGNWNHFANPRETERKKEKAEESENRAAHVMQHACPVAVICYDDAFMLAWIGRLVRLLSGFSRSETHRTVRLGTPSDAADASVSEVP